MDPCGITNTPNFKKIRHTGSKVENDIRIHMGAGNGDLINLHYLSSKRRVD